MTKIMAGITEEIMGESSIIDSLTCHLLANYPFAKIITIVLAATIDSVETCVIIYHLS